MKAIIFLLITMLVLAVPPTQALDWAGALKDVLKSDSPDQNSTRAKKITSDESGADGRAIFNLKSPSREEEVQIGREITGSLLGAAPLVNEAALQIYVNQVGRWIADQSERADLPWRFGVIESEDINAFAAPGGYVVITKGLYRRLQNEAQLAGVLAHEIAHVVRSHHLKILQQTQLLDFGAGLLGRQASGENPLIRKIIGNGAEICARSLDQNAEFEADRMGVVLAARAGYEPYGLPEVLQVIGQSDRNDRSVALLFKTHPHPDDRLIKLDDAIGEKFDRIKGKTLDKRLYKLK